MILQALYDYAKRKGNSLPDDGFEIREIKFLIKIKQDGSFVSLVDTRESQNGKLIGKKYLAPQQIKRSGKKSYETAYLLWDHYGYLLNQPKADGDKEKETANKQNEAFIALIEALPKSVKQDEGVSAVINFYKKYKAENYRTIKNGGVWEECAKIPGCNLSFTLLGDDCPVFERDAVKRYQSHITAQRCWVAEEDSSDVANGRCLITGEESVLARLHSSTPIIGTKSNASLVGFQTSSGYDSYGKSQSYNAPVSVKAEMAYTKALNYLIKSKTNKFRLGGDTVVFWVEKKSKEYDLESSISAFFSNDYESDNPDRCVIEVKNLLSAIYTGKLEDVDSRFYVLCLSPNIARISVRFWETGTVAVFAARIKQHFNDLEIVLPPNEPEYLNLYQILSSIALNGKMDNLAPNLIGSVAQSILKGLPYPATLQQQCIRRIRAERKIGPRRAAILKAILNRKNRYVNGNEEVSVALDRSITNSGYLLGRLFAVLEMIQKDTHPGLNSTITDRFYGAASSNPSTVFTQLMRLNQHHMSSYENIGLKTAREKELGEIMIKINSFPAHLDLNEQSFFAIGYYHEKQSFYEKTNKTDKLEGGI